MSKLYRHYKGGEYRVLCLAQHVDTSEVLVIYQPLNRAGNFARTFDEFYGSVEVDGIHKQRFEYLGDEDV